MSDPEPPRVEEPPPAQATRAEFGWAFSLIVGASVVVAIGAIVWLVAKLAGWW